MRNVMMKSLMVLMMGLLAAGCATTGGKSPEELVAEKTAAWKTTLEANDLEAHSTLYSEAFTHPEYGDKKGMIGFLGQAKDMGYLDGIKVVTDQAQTKIEGNTATVYPIDVQGSFGTLTFELVLTKEDGGWMITGSEASGM